MELFVFNENPLDFSLICKYKKHLGNNGIKKIQKTLRSFVESDLSSPNNLEVTVLKEKTKNLKEIEYPNKLNFENTTNKEIMKNEEVEDTVSSAENEENVFYE